MSYGNGSSLSRGEFVAHMERVDETLKGIDERLDRIEVKLDAPRRALATLWGTAVGRILMLLTTLLLAHAAATAGIAGWLPFIGP